MSGMIETLYQAAQRAGLLKIAVWTSSSGASGGSAWVDFRAPDGEILNHFQLNTDYQIHCPLSAMPGISATDQLQIDGIDYRVQAVRAIRDGSELEIRLCKP